MDAAPTPQNSLKQAGSRRTPLQTAAVRRRFNHRFRGREHLNSGGRRGARMRPGQMISHTPARRAGKNRGRLRLPLYGIALTYAMNRRGSCAQHWCDRQPYPFRAVVQFEKDSENPPPARQISLRTTSADKLDPKRWRFPGIASIPSLRRWRAEKIREPDSQERVLTLY